ncbi:hypothetical protein [Alicyclobacillus macrosporangiidus]|uniref:PepSY-associated TM region n=1 Tax=Alicyclobacillus macrosporangiidus TaxID=392015 RepID=A0A1I7L0V0_9BACL|nr:hypothetical protein [Alicyclobacillus macrosporangiidus]SFV03301.1 hypothetical protein SAMN05421543_12248 [Alicyclobacillus macrosporangiidus]
MKRTRAIVHLLFIGSAVTLLACLFYTALWWFQAWSWQMQSQHTIHAAVMQADLQLAAKAVHNLHVWLGIDAGWLCVTAVLGWIRRRVITQEWTMADNH